MAKEWYIDTIRGLSATPGATRTFEGTHVIEYSAYEHVCKERDAALECMQSNAILLRETLEARDALNAQSARHFAEVERLRKIIKELEKIPLMWSDGNG